MSFENLKWLDILKVSGWQTGALSVVCGILWRAVENKTIPVGENSLWAILPFIGMLICGALCAASVLDWIARRLQPFVRVQRWALIRREAKEAEKYIPHMTPQDRDIIACLLHHNWKMFTNDIDGGYASGLISRGIIRSSLRAGQVFRKDLCPFEIPDHIWKVLEKHQKCFPYHPLNNNEPFPWVTPWF